MGEKDWRKPILEAALRARELPYINMSGIAEMIGWKKQSLAQFLFTGHGAEDKVSALGDMLTKLGLLDIDNAQWLGDELHLLSVKLRDKGVPESERMAYAVESLRLLFDEMERMGLMTKSPAKRGK